jgi:hypothetical protein
MYDNSTEADPSAGRTPKLKPVLHMEQGKILGPTDLTCTPNWAKPIVAAALKLNQFISPFDHRSRSTGISQPRDMDSCVSVRIGYLDGLKVELFTVFRYTAPPKTRFWFSTRRLNRWPSLLPAPVSVIIPRYS